MDLAESCGSRCRRRLNTRRRQPQARGRAPFCFLFLPAHLLRLASAVACGLLQQTASEGEPQVENRAVESDVGYSRARVLELSAPGTHAATRAQSSGVQSLATRTSRGAAALALGVVARVYRVVELTFGVQRAQALELSASGTRMGHARSASGKLPPRYANLAGGGYSLSRRAGSYILDAPVTSYIFLDAPATSRRSSRREPCDYHHHS